MLPSFLTDLITPKERDPFLSILTISSWDLSAMSKNSVHSLSNWLLLFPSFIFVKIFLITSSINKSLFSLNPNLTFSIAISRAPKILLFVSAFQIEYFPSASLKIFNVLIALFLSVNVIEKPFFPLLKFAPLINFIKFSAKIDLWDSKPGSFMYIANAVINFETEVQCRVE